MKVLIVNTYDKGGAANACIRLHEGLLNEGIDSKALLRFKTKRIKQTFQFKVDKNRKKTFISKGFSKLVRNFEPSTDYKQKLFLNSRSNNLEMFSFPNSDFDITESPLYKEADIINLHWVANFLDFESFFRKNTKPIVWTLHDMNAFSGGEHFEEPYIGMDEDGFPILRVVSNHESLIAKQNLVLKLNSIKDVRNLTIVAPSRWLANKAKQSSVFRSKEVHCIPYGINSEIYKPRDKTYSKLLFNFPLNKKIILFVADAVSRERKGFKYLKKALESLENDDVMLYAVGDCKTASDQLENVIYLGEIKEELLMSIVYSAADVFVIPSLMDNLPNTALEALLCGTPVIGFPVGGIPDMIQHGENGLLTNKISVKDLIDTIQLFLNDIHSFNRITIRENAIRKYELKIQAKNYKKLFEQLLK